MKASFFKRLSAYLIDVLFVSLIVSIITFGVSNTEYQELYDDYEEITNKFSTKEITVKEYFKESNTILYDMEKSNIIYSSVTLSFTVVYFILFQYLNKGKTLGKMLLKIKVVENDKNPSLKAIILRTIIVNSILSELLNIALLYILNKNNYGYTYYVIEYLELIFIFITTLFILYRKDKMGLHDIISHTEVIEERGN